MGLEYDNSAFYYFMISMLSLYLIPGWYYTAKYAISAFISSNESHRSELEKKKQDRMKTNQQGWDKLNNKTFLVNALAVVAFSLLFLYLVVQVMGDSAIASFDPYTILSIDRGATDKQIKKAYKLKALEFHPDKNINDEHAANMFMLIAKAYEALTDDVARENWEKYGNPDGKQSFEMSIGLPTFLMEKGNHNLILISYLIIMVVIVPSIVWAYYKNSQMYGENNIMYRTYQTYANLLLRSDRPPVTKLKLLPELFATAAEFEGVLAAGAQDQEGLKTFFSIFQQVNAAGAKAAGKRGGGAGASSASGAELMAAPSKWLESARAAKPANYWRVFKGNLILHAHLSRVQLEEHAVAKDGVGARAPELPPSWAKALDKMLVQAVPLLNALTAIVMDSKRYESSLEAIKFSQCLVQGLWPRGCLKEATAPFYQLPHVGSREVAEMAGKVQGAKGTAAAPGSLKAYLRAPFNGFCGTARASDPGLSDEEVRAKWDALGADAKDAHAAPYRKGLDNLSDSKRADVERVLAVLPDVDVGVRHFVHDEEFVCERDTVTLEVKLLRHHVSEGGTAPAVHAPYFPAAKKEEWWVVLKAEDNRLNPWEMVTEKVTDQAKEVVTEVKFPAPPRAGKYKFTVHVISDSYLGLDFKSTFELQVESAAELPEVEDAYEKEDLELETALEATFGNNNQDSDVSSDEDSDDEAAESKATAKKAAASGGLTDAQLKKKEKRLAAAAAKGKKAGAESEDAVIVEAADADSSTDEELD